MSKKKDGATLTDQQDLFCREYLKDLNGKQAAIRAHYSEKTAEVQASKLLSIAKVRARVNELLNQQIETLDVTNAMILRGILRIATVDLAKAFDDKGNLRPIDQIPEEVRQAIAGIETEEITDGFGDNRHKIGETKKLKLSDRLKAWELLAKYRGMLTEKHEITHKLTLEQLVAGSNEEEG